MTDSEEVVITTCGACGTSYLRTALVACAECGTPFAGEVLAPGGDDEVGYDLADWGAALRVELARALGSVPHRWEGDELVVRDADAAHVEELIDAIDHPDALEEQDDDGGAGAHVLSAFYVAADVLQHDGSNPSATVELVDAIEAAPDLAPYGIEAEVWERVLALASTLADRLGDDEGEEGGVEAAAAALREMVRPLV